MAELDLTQVKNLTCRSDSEAIDNALAASGGLNPDVDLTGLQAQIHIDISGLNFVENNAGQDRASVRVTGSVGDRQVAQDVTLIKEDGVWKVCTSSQP